MARLALASIVLWAAACSRGPETPDLTGELQRRLDTGFEDGLFRVAEFRRRGSAPFHDLEKGRSGVFVYFDAELEFQREYELSSWGGLNLGTLAYVAGARPAGIRGFDPKGNKQGDRLSVHGRQGWQELETGWTAIAIEPLTKPDLPVSSLEGTGPESLVRQIRDFVGSRSLTDTETREGMIYFELRHALRLIDLQFARMQGIHTLGTGQLTGTYSEFGRALAKISGDKGLPFHAYPSAGSVENAVAIQQGRLDFGIVQSDVAEAFYEGIEGQQLPLQDLRSVASLWPEVVHIVTLEGSGIRSLADLEGKRLSVGQLGSGTRLNAVAIGRVADFRFSDFADVRETVLAESIAELEEGEVDAIFVTEAVPSRSLQDLTQRRDDVRFVPLDPATLRQLTSDHFAYYGVTVPARTYPGQEQAFRALGLAAVMVTHAQASDDLVTGLLDLLLDETDDLSRANYRAGFISSDTVRLGIALPLHPAAKRYYAERDEAAARPAESEEDAAEPDAGASAPEGAGASESG